MKLKLLAAAAVLSFASAGQTAVITEALEFNITGMEGPTANHNGAFSYTYDNETLESSLNWISYSIRGVPFTTSTTGIQRYSGTEEYLVLGGLLNGLENVSGNTDDFFLLFDPAAHLGSLAYSQIGFPGAAGTQLNEVVLTTYTGDPPVIGPPVIEPPGGIPEPTTWAMLILGFGFVGAGLRASRSPYWQGRSEGLVPRLP